MTRRWLLHLARRSLAAQAAEFSQQGCSRALQAPGQTALLRCAACLLPTGSGFATGRSDVMEGRRSPEVAPPSPPAGRSRAFTRPPGVLALPWAACAASVHCHHTL